MKLCTTKDDFERMSKEAIDAMEKVCGQEVGFLVLLQSLDANQESAFLATGSNLPQEAAVTLMQAHIEVMNTALSPHEGAAQ
jgi:hypothetical protein